jgi:hypothetical protein
MNWEKLEDIMDAPHSQRRPTTQETLESIEQFQHRSRSSIRITTGRVMEDDVFKNAQTEELKKSLP